MAGTGVFSIMPVDALQDPAARPEAASPPLLPESIRLRLAGLLTPGSALAATLYLLACIIVTWPTVLSLGSVLLGHPGNDTWNHVWGFWWVSREILDEGRWPGWTDLIAYPRGGSLYFIDTFNALLTLPLQVVFGPVVVHNLIIMGSLWFSAFSAWLLARHVARSEAAALVAGMIYGFSPHILGQAENSITETINTGWLALYLLALFKLLEKPSLRRGLGAGATLVLCGLSNWYYGLFCALATVVLALHRLLRHPYALQWKKILGLGLLGAIPFAPIALGGLLLLQSSMSAPDALVNRDPDFVWNSLLYHNMTDIQCLFRPGHFQSPNLKALYGENLLIVTYLGWVALLMAAWAVWRWKCRHETGPWSWLALVFSIFALGPYLYAFGHYVEVGGRRIPLPFLAFFEALPIFSRISHPFRFVVVVDLSLGVLAAYGIAQWGRVENRRIWQLSLLGCALVLAEICLFSPARVPLTTSSASVPPEYQVLDQDESDGAVLDLPIAVPILERAVYNWYQLFHQRPIPYSLNEPLPPAIKNNQLCQFLLRIEAGRARLLPRTLPDLELVMATRILARQGFRYIVIHERLYPEIKRQQVHSLMDALLGPALLDDGGDVTIYVLP